MQRNYCHGFHFHFHFHFDIFYVPLCPYNMEYYIDRHFISATIQPMACDSFTLLPKHRLERVTSKSIDE